MASPTVKHGITIHAAASLTSEADIRGLYCRENKIFTGDLACFGTINTQNLYILDPKPISPNDMSSR
jgi:hypothetical protein